jgi:hypothetical protein
MIARPQLTQSLSQTRLGDGCQSLIPFDGRKAT